MSSTDRQNRLLLAEDWKKVYQSFRNADFKSYDFDSLRRTMIQYLRENYPEDFNDYIESSEYLALIDLIAFLGQNIAFRVDLNARENFIELAERRESVLRLARLLSYNVKRNKPANGLLKFTSIQTTEDIVDSNGNNLAETTVLWNDPSNSNWKEQFIRILNASLPTNGIFGKPIKKDSIDGVLTEKYRFDATNSGIPVYSFSKNVNGINTPFEMVSTDIEDGNILEEAPLPGNSLAFLYREDGQGNGSANTGFFVHFRQGILDQGNFNITNPTSNQRISIDTTNINDSDVWLYGLDSVGSESSLWTKTPSIEGNNVIYNSIAKGRRNIYAIQSRIDDRINLIFADGIFGNLPRGGFRIYYRTSANRSYSIRPGDLINITLSLDYLSRSGQIETVTINCELKQSVENASLSETNASIRQNAPQTYYTQNRMVTGEDYQIAPLNTTQEIIKVKSINRTSSGISRYFDLVDATGKYSNVNLIADDGVVYKESLTKKNSFTFISQTDIEGVIENTINDILNDRQVRNFYLSNYAQIITDDLQARWSQSTSSTNLSTGLLYNISNIPYQVGAFTGGSLKYIEAGALLKFVAPLNFYFDKDNNLRAGTPSQIGDKEYIWTKVISVNGSGVNENADGTGPIVFNNVIPQNALLSQIIPKFNTFLTDDVKSQIIDQIFTYKTFGLRYDQPNRTWRVIIKENLNSLSPFSTGKAGDNTNNELDSSWLLLFETNGEKYTITNRGIRYVFESDQQINFYFDNTSKIYDTASGRLVKDQIKVLSINNQPNTVQPFTTDTSWEIVDEFRDESGYVNSKKVEVGFYDQDLDGTIDDPDIYTKLTDISETPLAERYIFLQRTNADDRFNYIKGDEIVVVNLESEIVYSEYTDGTVFYIVSENIFKVLANNILTLTSDYRAFEGRSDLKFQYIHSADSGNRIDPSASNIVDCYLLTKNYDIDFRKYLRGTISNMPLPPSSDELFMNYGADINRIKSLSDEVIFHPVKYKVLFGNKANTNVQAVFKIVKNPDEVVNDNDVKSRVIAAINQFFALDNWDFGDQFNFSELATYVMNALTPDLVSFIIVPKQADQSFGSLFEIKAESDEIFVSGATVDDVEVIDSVTASRIQASGNVVTMSSSTSTGVQSSNLSSTTTSTTSSTTTSTSSSSNSSSGSSGGGYSY